MMRCPLNFSWVSVLQRLQDWVPVMSRSSCYCFCWKSLRWEFACLLFTWFCLFYHVFITLLFWWFFCSSFLNLPDPRVFQKKMEQIILFLVKINIHCSCSLQFSRTQRDIAPTESPARIWCKTNPTLLDQQWSYRVQTSWEVWFIGELVFALAQWKEWDSKYSASCIVLPSSHKASQNLTWHKYFPMRSIGYIYRFCLGWQPSCGLYNSLIQSCIIFLENTIFFFLR